MHVAFFGERTILLDVARDRYRLLGRSLTTALLALREGDQADHVVALLRAHGLIASGEEATPQAGVPPVSRSAIEYCSAGRSDLRFTTAAAALVAAGLRLKTKGLSAALSYSRQMAAGSIADAETLVPLVQAYHRHRSRLPVRPLCLPDSLALHGLLGQRGILSSLVIGVRLDPFAAHCWLQVRDLVLNDSCDAVSGFTPILVQ